jgi:hypothetical protein
VGNNTAKAEEKDDLPERIRKVRLRVQNSEVSAAEARQLMQEVSSDVGTETEKLSPEARKDVLQKLAELDEEIGWLAKYEKKKEEKNTLDRLEGDIEQQLAKSRAAAELVPLYSREFGSLGPVAALLNAGKSAGGYRNPKPGLKLEPIKDAVHAEGCRNIGFNASSTSNGLVNRIRERSRVVTESAYKAGYNVEDAGVQAAMGALAREIAFTLSSDSGGRSEKTEHQARGMSYMTMRETADNTEYLNQESKTDPRALLADLERSLISVQGTLSTATGELENRLKKERDRINAEIADLKKKLDK